MKHILGVSAGYHDAAVAVVREDGEIVFAAHSERYSKRKHDKDLCEDLIVDALKHTDSSRLEFHYYERPWIKACARLASAGLPAKSFNCRPRSVSRSNTACQSDSGHNLSSRLAEGIIIA